MLLLSFCFVFAMLLLLFCCVVVMISVCVRCVFVMLDVAAALVEVFLSGMPHDLPEVAIALSSGFDGSPGQLP